MVSAENSNHPQNPSEPQSGLTREVLLNRITNRIRQSLELQEILSATVAEVRSFLGTDRVKIYQFQPDGHGLVIAESRSESRLPSLLGLHFPAEDIPLYARELFVRSRQRSVVDLSLAQIGTDPLDCPETGKPLRQKKISYRSVDPCHVKYLTAMGVKSSVVVPIVIENQQLRKNNLPSRRYSDQLWGLLVSHHSETRQVSEQELEFIQSVVDRVSIAIAQSILLDRVREQANQEANINRVTAILYTSPTVQIQEALKEIVSVFQGSGGRVYLGGGKANQSVELYTCGEQPEADRGRPLEESFLWQNYLTSAPEIPKVSSLDAHIWAIEDLYKEPLFHTLVPCFQCTRIRSLFVVPLRYAEEILGCLTIFRDEIERELVWAGYYQTDTKQLMPRQSFEAWRELKTGQAQKWTEGEIRLAKALGDRFSTAVKQYRLYQQVQTLNLNLEQQVQVRTTQLQQSNQQLQKSTIELQRLAEQQKTMTGIFAKIQRSLDSETIFRTTTQELRLLLDVDRIAIYRFDEDWGGEFIAHLGSVRQEWADTTLATRSVWNDSYLQATQGGRYRHNETFVSNDIYQSGLSTCHVEILAQYQVKAFIITPIFIGNTLWGLLAIYQHENPRQWKSSEVEFVTQIATQLGVAVQQSQYIEQVQAQAQQLAQTLAHLQETQTHLIHSEKMSSLGQLVAGVAHEINNPVNFIYGNCTHISDYTQTLLELLNFYQQHFPEPPPELKAQLELADLEFLKEDLPKVLSSLQLGADRIREIVRSLRNFSRLDEAEVKSVNIHEGIDSTLLILQHRFKPISSQPAIEVIKEYGELPLVECFASQLNQVFMNLLVNAIDTLREVKDRDSNLSLPPQITIRTQHLASGWIKISIIDNGVGITKEVQQKLFEPFYTTKPIGKGTGLGLSISYQIIEKHHGKIYCISELGKGTEFVVEIPVKIHLEMWSD
ncbi:GAF domain-containing protein [Oscillatoria salina]|uniref:GAF domain-containing protein n=1 Tax=Oscillatoria salina TaxID=331517 RepID=UPI0013BA8693|nr:GAF domain-containing protein [Oscillatoria salina]MBZ8179244.1 GAF domain-containing protein [Oscillatoria salina IIICB1]NET89552.1 GAF domain-containing protein [Kamptonema sp. SIO1D9]